MANESAIRPLLQTEIYVGHRDKAKKIDLNAEVIRLSGSDFLEPEHQFPTKVDPD